MRYALLFTLIGTLSLSSCIMDNMIPVPLIPDHIASDQSYISLSVVEESESAEHAGCWSDEPFYEAVPRAKVDLTYLEEEERPFPADVAMEGYTDDQGRLLFENLPAGAYRITVSSGLNVQDRQVTVSLGEVSRVYVRF